jgi:hypothetical protein
MAYYDYDALLRRWETVCGRESIHPVILDGPIEQAFLDRLGLTSRDFTALEERVNVGLSPAGLSLLRDFNQVMCRRPWSEGQQLREALMLTLERRLSGFGAVGMTEEGKAFQARFDASNERIRERYFPWRTRLFEEDWAIYEANGSLSSVPLEAMNSVVRKLTRIFLAKLDGEPLPMSDDRPN